MTSDKKELTDKQRIEFAKQLEYFYEVSHPSWRRVATFSFLKGIATGFGIFLGGTILIALLLWLLNVLGHVPFLNEVIEPVKETLDTSN